MLSLETFNTYRDNIIKEFNTESIFFKKKLTQAAFWTIIDKDLANQYFRDERWFFNIKYKDEIKFIDHGVEELPKTGVGFGRK